jgi:hypothetical protein
MSERTVINFLGRIIDVAANMAKIGTGSTENDGCAFGTGV